MPRRSPAEFARQARMSILSKSLPTVKEFRETMEKAPTPIYDELIEKLDKMKKQFNSDRHYRNSYRSDTLNIYGELRNKLVEKYPELSYGLSAMIDERASHHLSNPTEPIGYHVKDIFEKAEKFAYAFTKEDLPPDDIIVFNSSHTRGFRRDSLTIGGVEGFLREAEKIKEKHEEMQKKHNEKMEKEYEKEIEKFKKSNKYSNLLGINSNEKNLLTMPSREEELKNLFKGGKTKRVNKKSRKTRKAKKKFFGLF